MNCASSCDDGCDNRDKSGYPPGKCRPRISCHRVRIRRSITPSGRSRAIAYATDGVTVTEVRPIWPLRCRSTLRRTFCTSSSRPWRAGRSPPARSALAAPLPGRRARAAQSPRTSTTRPKITGPEGAPRADRASSSSTSVVNRTDRINPAARLATDPGPHSAAQGHHEIEEGRGRRRDVPGLTRPARSTMQRGRRGTGRCDQGRQQDRRHNLPAENDRRRRQPSQTEVRRVVGERPQTPEDVRANPSGRGFEPHPPHHGDEVSRPGAPVSPVPPG